MATNHRPARMPIQPGSKRPHFVRRGAALLVLALCFTLAGSRGPAADNSTAGHTTPGGETKPLDEMHRALGILSYVLGDYPLAVNDGGQVVDEFEYREQIVLLEQVRAIFARRLGLDVARDERATFLRRELESLMALVQARSAPDPVLERVARLRDALITNYDLQLAPPSRPSLTRGRALYRNACAVCHGPVGRARTPMADSLDPRPTNLLSRHLDRTLSPYQTFNVVTYGVSGTSMPTFEALTPDERWDVAFYVLAMRQRAVPRRSAIEIRVPLDVLARSTDAELSRWLAERGVPEERRASEVARLRSTRFFDSD